MAGLRSNIAQFSIQKQSVKGTAVAVPTWGAPFTDGGMMPHEENARLEETDATRAQGDSYKKQGGGEGSTAAYLRDSYAHALLEAGLGLKVDSGSTPNYIHTVTPSNTLAYWTVCQTLSNTLFEQYTDAVCNQLEINIEAGSPGTISADWLARKSERLAVDPFVTASIVTASDAPYNFNDAAVTLSGGATSAVSSLNLVVNNNCEYQQTDDYSPYDIWYGRREITVGFDMIFEDLNQYKAFHYPLTSNTLQGPTIYTTDLDLTITHGANNVIQFTLPRVTIEEFPVAPDQSGDPIVVAVRGSTKRGGTADLTAVVKNQVAT